MSCQRRLHRTLFNYLSLLFRLLWVFLLCNSTELWPKEQVSSRDCDQQCNASLNRDIKGNPVYEEILSGNSLSPAGCCIILGFRGFWKGGEGYPLVQFSFDILSGTGCCPVPWQGHTMGVVPLPFLGNVPCSKVQICAEMSHWDLVWSKSRTMRETQTLIGIFPLFFDHLTLTHYGKVLALWYII